MGWKDHTWRVSDWRDETCKDFSRGVLVFFEPWTIELDACTTPDEIGNAMRRILDTEVDPKWRDSRILAWRLALDRSYIWAAAVLPVMFEVLPHHFPEPCPECMLEAVVLH